MPYQEALPKKGGFGSYSINFAGVNFQPWSFFKELIGPNTFSDGGRWRPNNSAWAVNTESCLPRTKCFLRRLYEVQGGWRSRLSSEPSSVLRGKLLVNTLWLNAVFNGCTLQRVFGIIKMQSPTDTNGAHPQQSLSSGFGVFLHRASFWKIYPQLRWVIPAWWIPYNHLEPLNSWGRRTSRTQLFPSTS